MGLLFCAQLYAGGGLPAIFKLQLSLLTYNVYNYGPEI